jgi:hypothetical protein
MQFFTLAAVFFSLAAMPQLLVANPLEARGGGGEGGGGGGGGGGGDVCAICPGTLYSLPKCCAVNVGGIVAADCVNPSTNPSTGSTSFKNDCTALGGRAAACCTARVLGLDVLYVARA